MFAALCPSQWTSCNIAHPVALHRRAPLSLRVPDHENLATKQSKGVRDCFPLSAKVTFDIRTDIRIYVEDIVVSKRLISSLKNPKNQLVKR